jgi:uncharacterized membrane protein YbhN (UPF0104 family)
MQEPPIQEASARTKGRRGALLPAPARHFLKFILGGAALWALVRTGALDPALVGRAFLHHPFQCVFAFLSFGLIVLAPGGFRWYLLLRMAGLKVGLGRTYRLHMIGIFFNGLIPGGTGGDLVKGYYIFKEHGRGDRALALTSMAMDRFLGLYGLLLVGVAMAWLHADLWRENAFLRINSLFYASVFLAFTLAIAFYFSPWSRWFLEHPGLHRLPGGRFLKSLSDSLMVYRRNPWGLLPALIITLVVDLGIVLLYWFFARALEIGLPFVGHAFVVPTLTMINGIPISPAGLGVGEAAGDYIYRLLGVAKGGEILALVHICVLSYSLAGMPFYFLFRSREAAEDWNTRPGNAPKPSLG